MPRRIKNYIIPLIAICILAFLFNTKKSFVGPILFQQTHHTHRIFPTDARLMDVIYLPYIIPNNKLCKKVRHVIVVHSAPGNFDQRSGFRETWGNAYLLNSFKAKLVFIIGRPRDDLLQRDLIKENDLNGDIIQGDFVDDYVNLTLKAVTGLRWVAENCVYARTVFKLDDDVFLDFYKAMFEIVPLLGHTPRQLICSAETKGPIYRKGESEINSKWIIPDSYFPNLSLYPMPFCFGFGVFMTFEIALELYELSKSTPFYRLDDVYIYGILANEVKGLSWRSETRLYSKDENFTLSVFRQQVPNGLLIGTVRSRNATLELWELTKQLHGCTDTTKRNVDTVFCGTEVLY